MVLLEPDKSRARIHQGAPVLGVQNSGFALGFRFEQVMGLFEYRMNNLQPWEYNRIVGIPVAALAILGTPAAGGTISATVGALSPYIYTITSQDMATGDPFFTAAQNFCNGFNGLNGASYIASPQPAVAWPPNPTGYGPQQWQIAFVANTSSPFTLTTVGGSGTVTYTITNGLQPQPQATFVESNETLYGYLNILDYLEGKVATASDLMKFRVADVVTFRPDEMGARSALYQYWRQRLADVWGIPLYPMGGTGGVSTGLSV